MLKPLFVLVHIEEMKYQDIFIQDSISFELFSLQFEMRLKIFEKGCSFC